MKTDQSPDDCPLCGNEVKIFDDKNMCYLACETCDLILRGANRANIVRKWNSRVPSLNEIELVSQINTLKMGVKVCQFCNKVVSSVDSHKCEGGIRRG